MNLISTSDIFDKYFSITVLYASIIRSIPVVHVLIAGKCGKKSFSIKNIAIYGQIYTIMLFLAVSRYFCYRLNQSQVKKQTSVCPSSKYY